MGQGVEMRASIVRALSFLGLISLLPACYATVQPGPPPPPPQQEAVPVSPGPQWFWIAGHWQWNGVRYVWVAGHWERHRPGMRWVPAHWENWNGRWRYVHGHWMR